ncbi:MAG: hypothetical protein WC928_02170 [Patescibacteria group bacterium]|jgi:hypothetical protein
MNKNLIIGAVVSVVFLLVVIIGFSSGKKNVKQEVYRLDKADTALYRNDSLLNKKINLNSDRLDAHVDKFIETDGVINGLKNDIGDLQRADIESKRIQDSLIKAGEAEKKRVANLYWQLNQQKKKTAEAEAKKTEGAIASSDKPKSKTKKKGGSSSFSFDDLETMFEDMLGDF